MIRASMPETEPSLFTSLGLSGFCQRWSPSTTVTVCVAAANPVAVAVTVTIVVPSDVSWTAVIGKLAEV
jgi:hypothetical protein